MAGASGKRISAQNAQTVKQLRLGFAVSNAVYILSLFLFRSGRSWTRLFYYSTTEIAAVVLWQQLEAMAKKGDDLAAAGLTAYMFDVLYVTWFVHVTTALLSTKFWWLYLSIPSYAIYRFGSFVKPYIWPSAAGGPSAAREQGGKTAVGVPAESAAPGLSKRQEKLKKREKATIQMR